MSKDLELLGEDFLGTEIQSEGKVIVKAEDIEREGSGIDFKEIFFEPQVGCSYLLKFLPNISNGEKGENITQRTIYKKLPDPTRKGKSFRYTSSNNAKTCKVLELFFELNDLKKAGDAIAEKKIELYLKRSQQGCCVVQILSSPVPEEIGLIRLFAFPTYGPNATISNLLDKKMNPSATQLKNGEVRENVFNLIDSSVMNVECVEKMYEGEKGRDFAASDWVKKHRGAILVDDTDPKNPKVLHEFSSSDLAEDGKTVKEECKTYFAQFLEKLQQPKLSVFTYFQYKEANDSRNDEDSAKYLKEVHAKVDEIVEVIKNKSLAEIAAYGKVDTNDKPKDGKAENILAKSIPDEIGNSMVMNAPTAEASKEVPAGEKDVIDDILNS